MSVWVKSSVEDSQPVKHDLDLVISPSPQVVEQADQSPHDDSVIPLWIIIQAVENWTTLSFFIIPIAHGIFLRVGPD